MVNSVNFSSSHFGQSYIIHVTIELEVEMKILIIFFRAGNAKMCSLIMVAVNVEK